MALLECILCKLARTAMTMPKTLKALAAALCLLTCVPVLAQTAPSGTDTVYSPEALQEDFRFLRAEIDRVHPDPGLFTSRETLRKAYDKVEAQLQKPMTRDQAWRALATLNPLFA